MIHKCLTIVVAAFVPMSFCFFVRVIICALAGNSGVWHRIFLPEMRSVSTEVQAVQVGLGGGGAKMPNLTLYIVVGESNLNLVLSTSFI
jgi:hypothetical protein